MGTGIAVGVDFCAEYDAVYAAMTNKPSQQMACYQNNLVSALVEKGYWARMDLFYNMAVEVNTAGEAQINWKNPGTFNLTDPGTTNPTFTSLEGFTGDGSSDYLSTNWIPDTHASNVAIGGLAFGVYERVNYNSNYAAYGCGDGTRFIQCRIRYSGYYRSSTCTSDGTYTLYTISDSQGLFITTRTSTTTQNSYQNTTPIGNTVSGAVTGLPSTYPMFLLATNDEGSPSLNSAGQISIFFCMDAVSPDEQIDIYNIINNYMVSINKAV